MGHLISLAAAYVIGQKLHIFSVLYLCDHLTWNSFYQIVYRVHTAKYSDAVLYISFSCTKSIICDSSCGVIFTITMWNMMSV